MIMKEARVGGRRAWHRGMTATGYENGGPGTRTWSVCSSLCIPATRGEWLVRRFSSGSHLRGSCEPRADWRPGGGRPGTRGGDCEAAAPRARRNGSLGTRSSFTPICCMPSTQNRSEHPRWSPIGCYNAKRNDPYRAIASPWRYPAPGEGRGRGHPGGGPRGASPTPETWTGSTRAVTRAPAGIGRPRSESAPRPRLANPFTPAGEV